MDVDLTLYNFPKLFWVFVDFITFFTHVIMSSMNKDSFTSFFSKLDAFYFFFLLDYAGWNFLCNVEEK